jgi:hypothetical protein
MFQVVEHFGYLSLDKNYIPQDFDNAAAQQQLRIGVPGVNPTLAINRLVDNGIVYRKNNLGSFYLRFSLDTMAEYVAAAYYFKQKKEENKLKEFGEEVLRLDDDAKGFKLAFQEVLQYFK